MLQTHTVNVAAGITKQIVCVRSNLTRKKETTIWWNAQDSQDCQVGCNNSHKNHGSQVLFCSVATYISKKSICLSMIRKVSTCMLPSMHDCLGTESAAHSLA